MHGCNSNIIMLSALLSGFQGVDTENCHAVNSVVIQQIGCCVLWSGVKPHQPMNYKCLRERVISCHTCFPKFGLPSLESHGDRPHPPNDLERRPAGLSLSQCLSVTHSVGSQPWELRMVSKGRLWSMWEVQGWQGGERERDDFECTTVSTEAERALTSEGTAMDALRQTEAHLGRWPCLLLHWLTDQSKWLWLVIQIITGTATLMGQMI